MEDSRGWLNTIDSESIIKLVLFLMLLILASGNDENESKSKGVIGVVGFDLRWGYLLFGFIDN